MGLPPPLFLSQDPTMHKISHLKIKIYIKKIMHTTDIQFWYKQAYWSQTKWNYKHGFFYNTQKTNVRDISVIFLFKKGHIFFFFNYIFFYSPNAQGILGTPSVLWAQIAVHTQSRTQSHTRTREKCLQHLGVAAVAYKKHILDHIGLYLVGFQEAGEYHVVTYHTVFHFTAYYFK